MNDNMQGWAGFPAGAVPTTRVPNTLFTDLLPIIDNLAELKVTLHLLWLISRKRGPLRYARLNELLADRLFLKGLETPMLDGASALRDGLERAEHPGQRGFFLRDDGACLLAQGLGGLVHEGAR